MPTPSGQFQTPLNRLEALVAQISPAAVIGPAVDRWRSDAAALRFHLQPRQPGNLLLLAVIGGTGTGKSTLVNRLLGTDASATSFRRTFTAGAVAIARDAGDVPADWLGVEHIVVTPDKLPARGQIAALLVVPRSALPASPAHNDLLDHAVVIDTPDLDGDQPLHHAEADRAFRWAQAVVFVVTPEKYQMTEVLPYYRLAARYATPALFVMNKCEEQAVVDDYRTQMQARIPENPRVATSVFTIPRDDAAYEPPTGENLAALRSAIVRSSTPESTLFVSQSASESGLAHRAADLVGRFEDHVLTPMRQGRVEADRLIEALHGMETPAPGIDVNPVTQDLERRLQQRSVLYLIGPQRVLERVRQAPTVLVRLPRMAWDFVLRGQGARGLTPPVESTSREVPDFKAVLTDQFSVLQSRIDDLLHSSPIAQKWMAADEKAYKQARMAAENAGQIADEELGELRTWLEKRWNATPRDTRLVLTLLRHLPGGHKLANWAESAPYLLTIALFAQHTLTHGVDLVILGGYSAVTWLTERLSNEVASRTRATNVRIAERFTRLAHDQIQKICDWIDQQAVAPKVLEQIDVASAELAAAAGVKKGGM